MRFSIVMSCVVATTLAAGLAAQAATYVHTAQPAPHYNPFPPWLTALNTPQIGSVFRLTVPGLGQSCACYPAHFLMTGFSNPSFDTTVLGPAFNGVLMTSGEITLGRAASAPPDWLVEMPIPNEPLLLGTNFYQQVVWLYSSPAYGPSVLLGRGGHGVIGT